MPKTSIDQQLLAVYARELQAWSDIAVCEAWHACFGPEHERAAHQRMADHANNEALKLAARMSELEDGRA